MNWETWTGRQELAQQSPDEISTFKISIFRAHLTKSLSQNLRTKSHYESHKITALCWLLLSVLQPCVDCCCLCCNLVLGALRITKKSMEQLQSPGAEMCGPTVIMERRMQIHWIPLSKLAFKGGFCVQKIDGVLSWWRLHLYMHVICRRPFFCSTTKRNCYALPPNWVTLTVTTATTALCRRECNPFFQPTNLMRPSPSRVQQIL